MVSHFKTIGLSFIGTNEYIETNYQYQDLIFKTNLFPKALEFFFDLEELYIVATEKAAQKHLLDSQFNSQPQIIRIPEGRSENELWEIFDLIYNTLPDSSNLIIDITHGYRSLPIIVLSAIIYLRTLKNANINKIIYGAFDARDLEKDITPVFDLTSFIKIIDWSYATNDFINHGNTALLRELLTNVHKGTYIEPNQSKSNTLYSIGSYLHKTTDALSMIRVGEISEYANKLIRSINDSNEDIASIPASKPIKPLLNLISERFDKLSLHGEGIFSRKGFQAQMQMIDYYIETEQYVQAITLAREAIVSKVCTLAELSPLDKGSRSKVEINLNEKASESEIIHINFDLKNYLSLWVKIRDLRNDINHAAMREGSFKTDTAISNIKQYCQEIKNLIDKYE